MKLRHILSICISLLTTTPLLADNGTSCDARCDTCCDCCCADWNFYADWLYWRTKRSGLDYAIEGEIGTNPTGKLECVDPGYDSGVRIGLNKRCGCWDYGLRWTSYYNSESDKTTCPDHDIVRVRGSNEYVSAGLTTLALAKSKYKIDLDIIDFGVGYLYQCDCYAIRPYAGFELAYIDQSIDSVFANELDISSSGADLVREDVDMDAYGLYFGIQGAWDICWCFYGFADLGGAILLGDFDSKWSVHKFDNGFKGDLATKTKKSRCLSITRCDAALGLGYDFCTCGCLDLSVEVGYEIHKWHDMPDFIQPYDKNEFFNRNMSNLSFDGLFVRLNAQF